MLLAALLVSMASCREEAPDSKIKVALDKGECLAGEPVTFLIDSKADNIVFYSGEPGHEYSLRDRLFADNDVLVDFVSFTDQSKEVIDNFHILVSSDFNGSYTATDVQAATWTDVTSLFTLPSKTGQNTPSGIVSLKSYIGADNDDLIYFAFRYRDPEEGAQKNRWVVRSINITKVSPEGVSASLATIKTAGWQNVALSGEGKWTLPGSQLLAAGNTKTNDKDLWAISAGYNIHTSEPSTGVVLKNISTDLDSFSYVYEEPGEYEAVFAASSEWYNSGNSSLTTVKVSVK